MDYDVDTPIGPTNPTAFILNEVVDRVKHQDPTITGVYVDFTHDSARDSDVEDLSTLLGREATAKGIGESRHVKYLSLHCSHSNDNMITFCNGLVRNKSIERLDLCIRNRDWGEIVDEDENLERLFELLGLFFANNENLESLVIEYDDSEWISK
jgi:hypothetical protein